MSRHRGRRTFGWWFHDFAIAILETLGSLDDNEGDVLTIAPEDYAPRAAGTHIGMQR